MWCDPQHFLLAPLQVLFSSHHTLHDYPDDKGVQLLESFLQACKVGHMRARQGAVLSSCLVAPASVQRQDCCTCHQCLAPPP